MEHIPFFSLIACAAAVVALACGCLCLVLANRARAENRQHMALAMELDGRLTSFKQDLEIVSRRNSEYRDRLSQIEAREWRKAVQEDPLEPAFTVPAPTAPRPTPTDRRHRVLRLAQRGLDTRTISETLGVPQGEVSLILGMNKARAEAE